MPNAADTLSSKQRAHLRALAHPLKPVLRIGKEGLTEAALQAITEAFNTRELVKVKVLENAPETARASGEAIAQQLPEVLLVQTIGRIVVLYRPHPDHPEIQLPR